MARKFPMDKREDRLVHWTDRKIDAIFFMALAGFSEVKMAEILEVSYNTFVYWKKTRPEVLKALNDGKLGANTEVVKAAYKLAVGYEYEEEVAVYDRSAHKWEKTTLKKVKHPDPWSAFRWVALKMRDEGWSETQRIQIDHNTNINIDIVANFSTVLLDAIEQEAKKMLGTDTQIALPEDAGDTDQS